MQQLFDRLQNQYDRLNSKWLELRQAHLVSQQDAKKPVTLRQLRLDYCQLQIEKGCGLYWPAWVAFLIAEIETDPGLHQALIKQIEREKTMEKEFPAVLQLWQNWFREQLATGRGYIQGVAQQKPWN